jgi:hypothetical protein
MSYRVRARGVGDTPTCPSLEQLMGQVDINDPCQAAGLSLPIPGGTPIIPAITIASPGGNALGAGAPSRAGWPQWATLAAVAAGLIVFTAITGGRR